MMKVTAISCMGFLMIGCGPLFAYTPASISSEGQPTFQMAIVPTAQPTPWKVAQTDTTTTTTSTHQTSSTDASESGHKKPVKNKKTSQNHPRSGAAVYREGGKTCSGLDEYKVCW